MSDHIPGPYKNNQEVRKISIELFVLFVFWLVCVHVVVLGAQFKCGRVTAWSLVGHQSNQQHFVFSLVWIEFQTINNKTKSNSIINIKLFRRVMQVQITCSHCSLAIATSPKYETTSILFQFFNIGNFFENLINL